ncbi:hypothetical protein AGDE_10739 [Angomonas deanei]|uniref:Uncharacterized protein n=1 Tax=Angomonas deanei TaxID=59799 RepID=A0A7G2CGR9_9TRYP|nr:hypothetical protein AGDE_10739 [Angomonas deanei]CAD2217893.1 hypothetical protein, conserved [Angomonas deanei]|eukprot:EPY27492.1 hypothetical protein AGDE_10739 [Angomonas deanei]
MMKRRAVRDRKLKDDFELREKAYKHKENKMAKTHWYHAMTVLEEFGMDGKTLRMNCIVFTVGCVPLFAIYAGTTLSTLTGNPSMAWPAISSVALICVYFVAWLSLLHRKNQWAMYTSFIFIGIQLVLGVVGVAVGQYPASIAIVLVSFVACQGMLTRKRRHALTRKELCDILKIPLNKKIEQQKSKRKVDSYLFCCRDLILDYLKCMDIKSRFGYRHPSVVQAEREYSIKNIALRVDHKALLVWWIIVMLAAAFVVAFGNSVSYQYLSPIATNPHTPVLGEKTDDPICSIVFNENGSAPMTLYDLALLAALSHTFGDNGATDFATWFGSKPDLVRQHPTRLPPTFKFATDGINMTFSDYVDLSSGFHFITLNSNSRGLAVFRDADEWGESIAYQVAGAVSPLISFWPEGNIRDYVVQGAFLKKWFPPSTVLHNVTAYVRDLVEEVGGDKVVIVGDQFNGGYAKLLLSNFTDDNVTFVAFNPPGTKYKTGAIHRGIQLTSVRSAWSFIDSLEDSEQTFFVPCDNSTMSSTRCGRISTAINYISKTCGDSEGRSILDV